MTELLLLSCKVSLDIFRWKLISATLTHEEDPEILELVRSWQQLIPNLEWALHPFLAENHGFRVGGADFHPNHFTLGCKPSQFKQEVIALLSSILAKMLPGRLRSTISLKLEHSLQVSL